MIKKVQALKISRHKKHPNVTSGKIHNLSKSKALCEW